MTRRTNIERAFEQTDGIMHLWEDYPGPDATMLDIRDLLITGEIDFEEARRLISLRH